MPCCDDTEDLDKAAGECLIDNYGVVHLSQCMNTPLDVSACNTMRHYRGVLQAVPARGAQVR